MEILTVGLKISGLDMKLKQMNKIHVNLKTIEHRNFQTVTDIRLHKMNL